MRESRKRASKSGRGGNRHREKEKRREKKREENRTFCKTNFSMPIRFCIFILCCALSRGWLFPMFWQIYRLPRFDWVYVRHRECVYVSYRTVCSCKQPQRVICSVIRFANWLAQTNRTDWYEKKARKKNRRIRIRLLRWCQTKWKCANVWIMVDGQDHWLVVSRHQFQFQ